ncbi:MAG: asparagine--tRNA ligase [Candidatus Shikimatogenerans bostrichidophilus]|nr:MAG: asparagine--tRNA ligase [Candidatus Shikimatogenerans bostrichidophilus]
MKYYYSIKEIIINKNKFLNKNLLIKGWIKFFRNNFFLEINDGSTIKNLQVVIKKEIFKKKLKKINIGNPIKIFGKLKLHKNNKDVEMLPLNIKLYGKIDKKFFDKSILQNKFHSLSKLRKQIYLRFRTKIFSSIMKIRHNLYIQIHNFFKKKHFYYINTPIISNNNAEGAGETFRVTTIDFENKKNNLNCKNDFFKCKVNLTVSGQLEAESAMLGLGKVYTFGPVFRAENSNTNKHLSEFLMVEPEIMFYKLKDIIKLSVKLIKYLIKKILKYCIEELKYLEYYHKKNNNKNGKNLIKLLKNIQKKKFIKISYNKVIKLLKSINNKIIFWGDDIGSKHEKILFEKIFKKELLPLIIYNYPKNIKPFYMKINKDNITTKSIDILFPYIGEIIGGSEREHSYKKLLKIIKKKNMNIKKIKWYLNIRKLGTIYHSGFGLGFDRLLQFITGMKNIRDVVPFPRLPGKI